MQDDKGLESKAALAPGTMIPAAGEPWEEMTVPRPEAVPYRKLLRWGWYVVSAFSRVVHIRLHSVHSRATPDAI